MTILSKFVARLCVGLLLLQANASMGVPLSTTPSSVTLGQSSSFSRESGTRSGSSALQGVIYSYNPTGAQSIGTMSKTATTLPVIYTATSGSATSYKVRTQSTSSSTIKPVVVNQLRMTGLSSSFSSSSTVISSSGSVARGSTTFSVPIYINGTASGYFSSAPVRDNGTFNYGSPLILVETSVSGSGAATAASSFKYNFSSGGSPAIASIFSTDRSISTLVAGMSLGTSLSETNRSYFLLNRVNLSAQTPVTLKVTNAGTGVASVVFKIYVLPPSRISEFCNSASSFFPSTVFTSNCGFYSIYSMTGTTGSFYISRSTYPYFSDFSYEGTLPSVLTYTLSIT